MFLNLRTSLLLALGLTSLPLAVVLVSVSLIWADRERQAAEERTLVEGRAMMASLEAMIDESRRALDVVANDPHLDWSDLAAVQKDLEVYRNHFPFSRGVFLFDPRGNLVGTPSDAAPVSVADRQWFRAASSVPGFTIGEFVLSRISGLSVLPMAEGVRRQGRVVAVLGMSIDLEWFYARIRGVQALQNMTITLVDTNAVVLVRYPEPSKYVGQKYPEPDLLARALAGSEVRATFPGLDGVLRLYSVEALRLEGRVVGAITLGVPVEEVQRRTRVALVGTLVAIALALGLSAGISAYGLRAFVLNPVRSLLDHTQSLAAGQFSKRMALKNLPGELALLAQAINSTAETLEKRDTELARHRTHLEDLVAERTAELEASRRELLRSNEELQQFAYVASHDLQEPLRMVASFTQLLERKYQGSLDSQAQEYIRYAVDGATRMQQLINDLLSYSRVGTQPKAFAAVDAHAVVQHAVDNLSVLIQERKAEVSVGALPEVVGDPGQLVQVFQNLISNGIKFNRSAVPRVQVSGRELPDGLAEFSVEDNGIGIDQEYRDRVFVIFQRLNPRGEFSGTGIGLAVCKRVVERHGGTILLEPTPTGGTRFRFTIPKSSPGRAP